MAGVFIDIPGVGNVEAKNAATEATLREILKAMQGVQKNTGSSGGTGSGSGGSGGAGAGGGTGVFTKSVGVAGKAAQGLGKAAGIAAGGLGKMATGAGFVVGKLTDLGVKSFDAADTLSKLDGSATSAVDVLGMIPGVGGVLVKVFSVVAGAADRMVGAFVEATASGATFGGSIRNFSTSASEAGMNLKEFGSLIARNGQAMGAFGITTEDGAKNFSRVSKQLRATGSDLYALGFSTQEINSGLANYGKILRIQGAQGTQTNAQLASGAKNYLKEMDLLAKVTGESRADKEKEREALAADGQFRAAMAGLGPDVEASAMTLIQSMPSKEMQDFAKDLIANGTATTDANRQILAQMPQLGAQFTALHSQTQRNVAVSKDQMNQTLNIGRLEGPAALKRIKTAAAADEGLRTTAAALGSFGRVNKDAVKAGEEQQNATAKNSDKFNEKMQKMSEVLAGVSNTFTELLASSGILDIMIQAIQVIADIAVNVLAPALRALNVVLTPVFQLIKAVIAPAFAVLSAVLEKVVYGLQLVFAPVFERISKITEGVSVKLESFKGAIDFVDTVINEVFGLMGGIVGGAMLAFNKIGPAISQLMDPLKRLWDSVSGLFKSVKGLTGGTDTLIDIFLEIGDVVGEVFGMIGFVVGKVVDIFADVFTSIGDFINSSEVLQRVFKTLKDAINDGWQTFRKYFSVEGMKAIWGNLEDAFESLGDGLKRWLNKFSLGAFGMSEKEAQERELERKDRAKARDDKLTEHITQRNIEVDNSRRVIDLNRRELANRNLYTSSLNRLSRSELGAREAAEEAAQKLIDYGSGPEELLRQFSAKEGGIVEMGVKKEEAVGQRSEASRELAQATTEAERTAAQAKIKEAEQKIQALEKAIELSKQGTATSIVTPSGRASTAATTATTELEARGEERTAAEQRTRQEAEAARTRTAAEQSRTNENARQPAARETAETLLTQLNNSMSQLIKISQEQKDIGERQLSVQRSLTGDLFVSF
jgi:hypothetical protein